MSRNDGFSVISAGLHRRHLRPSPPVNCPVQTCNGYEYLKHFSRVGSESQTRSGVTRIHNLAFAERGGYIDGQADPFFHEEKGIGIGRLASTLGHDVVASFFFLAAEFADSITVSDSVQHRSSCDLTVLVRSDASDDDRLACLTSSTTGPKKKHDTATRSWCGLYLRTVLSIFRSIIAGRCVVAHTPDATPTF